MATVSHELANAALTPFSAGPADAGRRLDESQNERAVATIIRNSETQNRLIEDLLDVARLISGKLQLEQDEVDLPAVVEHSAESLKPLAARKNVEIIFVEDRPGDDCKIIGDRNRLVQVFSNVLENAIKFSEVGDG